MSCRFAGGGEFTCWNVASSNPRRRNSAMTALRKSCSCTDAHLNTHTHRRRHHHQVTPLQMERFRRARISLDGRDVGGGEHLIQRRHHVTHPHQPCGSSVSRRVLADLRCSATDVQTAASVARQSGHLREESNVEVSEHRANRLLSETRRSPTFLDTSCSASSSKALTLFSRDMMICCSCLKPYGWKDILVKPCKHQANVIHRAGRSHLVLLVTTERVTTGEH